KNARVLGKFKDELGGKRMIEFIALRPKMYSMQIHEKNTVKNKSRRKGIPQTVKVTHADYQSTLRGERQLSVNFQRITHTKDFHLVTQQMEKRALSSCD